MNFPAAKSCGSSAHRFAHLSDGDISPFCWPAWSANGLCQMVPDSPRLKFPPERHNGRPAKRQWPATDSGHVCLCTYTYLCCSLFAPHECDPLVPVSPDPSPRQSINEKPQIVGEYESGKAIPNPQIISKLERALGVRLPRPGKKAKK